MYLDRVKAEGESLIDGCHDAIVAAPASHLLEPVRPQRVNANIEQAQTWTSCKTSMI